MKAYEGQATVTSDTVTSVCSYHSFRVLHLGYSLTTAVPAVLLVWLEGTSLGTSRCATMMGLVRHGRQREACFCFTRRVFVLDCGNIYCKNKNVVSFSPGLSILYFCASDTNTVNATHEEKA